MNYRLAIFFLLLTGSLFAQKTSAEIYHHLQKVHALKRVLYIAAHPDDENTRALAYLSNGELAETAYLSLTRGDGGQNLIGDELSEDLGVLRTQELLAARSVDGAKQYFTRAVDFGYSKSAEESFEKWGKDEILSDVVLVIRQFKPDVIITRFPPDKRGGHGHHTASAMLAIEAFDKAADPNFIPHQVAEFGAWKTGSIYWNSSYWWDQELSEKAKNNPNYLVQEIGGYNPLLGQSYNEIGTIARSQHKCQGFGAIVERGSLIEYFEHLGGKKLKKSFFENNTANWSDLVSNDFANSFNALLANFDFVKPENNVPQLLALRKELLDLPSSKVEANKQSKIAELNQIIIDCLGLYIDITTEDYAYPNGEDIVLNYNLLNRSSLDVKLNGIRNQEILIDLPENQVITKQITIKNTVPSSTPYWLKHEFNTLFTVDNKEDLGKAENDPSFSEELSIFVNGEELKLNIPVIYKWRDPSFGERKRPVISSPDYTVNFDQKSIILKPDQSKTIKLKIHSFKESINDEIKLEAPAGWNVSPQSFSFNATSKHAEIWQEIKLTPTQNSQKGQLILKGSDGKSLSTFNEITYDHIPTQVIFKPAELTCVPINAKIKDGKIAYINGAGDGVAQAIEQLGFKVDQFEVNDLSTVNLSQYQSVVLGIRIYNVHPELRNFDQKLFEYVENGGNVVMQYNTASRRPTGEKFGPTPFELSRNRVTEEDAAVHILAPEHPIFNQPNKITTADFKNWDQERGLYFASNYEENYTPLISWHDKGETPQEGGLIVTSHGKGRFIYTGISFFRELPNGVEGAYRLFANLLSY